MKDKIQLDSNEKLCEYRNCSYNKHKNSDYCIFHMSAKEKNEKGLWEDCMKKFYNLVEHLKIDSTAEGNFQGFILRNVNLSGQTMKNYISFKNGIFVGEEYSFQGGGATFHKEVDFTKAKFEGIADFNSARFDSEAIFFNTKFISQVNFLFTTFASEITFFGSQFEAEVDFFHTKFEAEVDFSYTTFAMQVSFKEAIFEKGGSFNNCKGFDEIAPKISFENAWIQYISFRGVILNNFTFKGAKMERIFLADAIWRPNLKSNKNKKFFNYFIIPNKYIMIDEKIANREADKSKKKEIALRNAMGTYRRVKHSLLNEGEYDLAGEFHIKEREMNRKILKNNLIPLSHFLFHRNSVKKTFYVQLHERINYFIHSLLYGFGGYGEKPIWIIYWAIAIIGFFAGLYFLSDSIFNNVNGINTSESVFNYLYFSIVTFTTLGYGDVSPGGAPLRLVASFEAIIGALMIAYFIVSVARKVMR